MRFKLKEYINGLGLKFRENSQKSHIILGNCPNCRKSNRFYIKNETGQFICHYCVERRDSDMKGGLVRLVSKLSNITMREAFAIVHKRKLTQEERNEAFSMKGSDVFGSYQAEEESDLQVMDDYYTFLNEGLLVDLSPTDHPLATSYLLGRGLTLDDLQKAEVKIFNFKNTSSFLMKMEELGISELDAQFYSRYIGRVIFPVKSRTKVVGLLGRDYTGRNSVKILNSKSPFRNEVVYNFNNVKNSSIVVVCESIINSIKCGIDRSVATFGKFITDAQMMELLKLPPSTIIVLMPDVDAIDSAIENRELLLCHFDTVYVVKLPAKLKDDGKTFYDSGDYSKEENQVYIHEAMGILENLTDDNFLSAFKKQIKKEDAKKPKTYSYEKKSYNR